MSINTISSPISRLYTAHNSVNPAWASTTNKASVTLSGDSDSPITISVAARQVLEAEQATTTSGSDAVQSTLPDGLSQLAIPGWFSDFHFVAPETKDGMLPEGNWFAEKYPLAAAAPREALDEYEQKLGTHFKAVFEANGLTQGADLDLAKFHQALIVDKPSGERIRQELIANIKQDPDMMRLMKQVGMAGALEAGAGSTNQLRV